jgi:hypothetical protein
VADELLVRRLSFPLRGSIDGKPVSAQTVTLDRQLKRNMLVPFTHQGGVRSQSRSSSSTTWKPRAGSPSSGKPFLEGAAGMDLLWPVTKYPC